MWMAHAQKPDFVFRRNGRVHLNRQGRQFSLLLAAEVCASVMLDTLCFEVVWRVLATHSIRQFHLHFLTSASPCAMTFQLGSNSLKRRNTETGVGKKYGHQKIPINFLKNFGDSLMFIIHVFYMRNVWQRKVPVYNMKAYGEGGVAV